ncbi:hydrogenase expression/formation protein HypE [Alkalihalobacterium elongatum]|uniref:hydrogenase expression/formation protein HypE n=1 Tax=Alkalihalobacterium elongatum TaxID=2675466 RepID=UPI001C1F63CA|nr:hydrogenase expression/formation protein HypE [Alkalihalobacterium elongatum]
MVQRISLAHGEGGELTHNLIQEVFVKAFGHSDHIQHDSAFFRCDQQKLAVTTDSYVVKPIFFPGGNIGKLAITGTVNDLAVSGATPQYMTASFIIEEGLPLEDLKKIVESMASEAKAAQVHIVAGDTKVVEKGSVDQLYINTTGIGFVKEDNSLEPDRITEGDSIIISGTIGDHGIAVLSAREDLGLISNIESDCASLNQLIQELTDQIEGIRVMRDPTRGGLATTLVELCEDHHIHIEIDEEAVPVRNDVKGACDILGFDPLYMANEGKFIMIVNSQCAQKALEILHKHTFGKNAQTIGRVNSCHERTGKLLLKTPIGATRRLQRLSGLLLPRIC